MAKILIVDDEKAIRKTLKEILEYEKYDVLEAADGQEAINLVKQKACDLVFLDIKMPRMDGMEVLEKIRSMELDIPVIMISGHGNEDTAVEAVKAGAFDYISKPPDLNRLLITVRNALENQGLATEAKALKRKIAKTNEIVGDSPAIQKVKDTIDRVAPTDARILITGQNGAGKELVARWVHEKSQRHTKPFIEVNCAAIPSELIESELFGHEKGAFTSAIKQRIGKFEQADGGTIFLDEIGDMSQSAQAKVLRALQENKITRVGGDKDISVNVRVVAATNKDLLKEIDQGNFRMDLYHRLSVILIHVPSLNDRKEDIPLLTHKFLHDVCSGYGMPIKKINSAAIEALKKITWSGNIRELRNVIERLIILGGEEISEKDVATYVASGEKMELSKEVFDGFKTLQDYRDFAEKQFIEYKLKKNDWNVTKTADEIDIQRSHLYNKIERYNLQRV